MEPVARLERFTVGFGARTVLHAIDLEVAPGEITVIVGPSGSGKTTLLRSFNRLNELFAGCRTAGRLALRLGGAWLDAYADRLEPAALRRKVAMVFQTPHVLPLSIRKNLTLPLRLVAARGHDAAADRIERCLRQAELFDEVRDRLDESALSLSGGQQQRLCLARALVLEPEILLLDEPTASLDLRATRRIEELLLQLKERYTIVAVSHSVGQASRLADRVVVLHEGRIAEHLDRARLHEPGKLEGLLERLF